MLKTTLFSISFLKGEDEDGNTTSKFMGPSDIIFLLVIVGLVFGFWYFNKSAKDETLAHYNTCDTLWTTERMDSAYNCYEQAIDLGYRTDSLDSVSYRRRELLDSSRATDGELLRKADSLDRIGDTASLKALKCAEPKGYFWTAEEKAHWRTICPM
jgi:hypothetical protein